MSSLYLIEESKNTLNTVGYLGKKEHELFFVSSSKEYSFGNSSKDVLEVGIYNLQKELSSYFHITSSKLDKKVTYKYSDVDGNSFTDYYFPTKNSALQDLDKNYLLSVGDVIRYGSVTSNNFYLSVNPISNLFSIEDPLTIKEISNSRKEIKLIKSFRSESIGGIHSVEMEKNSLRIDGSSSVKFKSGIVHVIKAVGLDVNKIRFSKVRGGVKNGSVEYNSNIVYRPSSSEIVIDATEDFPKVLFAYHRDISSAGVEINLSESVSVEDFKLNTEFSSLKHDGFVYREISDELTYELSTVNLTELYDSTKQSFYSQIVSLRNLLSFSNDSEVLELISSIYNGVTISDSVTGKNTRLLGIREFIDNHIKFNFEFLGDFKSFRESSQNIISSVCESRLRFYNPHAIDTKSNKENFSQAVIYLKSILTSAVQSSISNVEYGYKLKFKSPLKSALNFGSGSLFPILTSKIENESEFWVKLKDPLSGNFSVGDKTSLSNISIIPTFELISWLAENSQKFIKLRIPNFSLNLNEPSDRTISTKYYSDNDLEISRVAGNKISVNKKLIDLNIDYSDFSNFVVFSSANLRLKIFKNKVIQLTTLDEEIATLSSVDTGSSEVNDRLSVYTDLVNKRNEFDSIIEGFDGYESYLYKSGQFVYDTNQSTFVYPSGSLNVSSAVDELLSESETYDKNNRDSLLNNSPEFIYEDTENDEYLKFLSMVGHHFDNLYLHISNIGIYKRIGHDLDDGLTGKIISYILNSFGFKLPPGLSGLIESSDTIENYLSSDEQSGLVNSISVDEKTKTIWKRMLINLPSVYKSKGTEECIRQIFSIYGVPNNLITLKEFGGGYYDNEISSSYLSEEREYLLEFQGEEDEYVEITGSWQQFKSVDFKLYIEPTSYSSSRIIVPIHEKFGTETSSTTQAYSLGFVKTGPSLGRFYFTIRNDSSHFTTLTDPVYLFSDEPMSVLLRKNYVNKSFGVEESSSAVPVRYDIKIYRSSAGGKSIDKETSFYLSGSLNRTFDATGSFVFGNSGGSEIEIVSEILEILETEESVYDFIREDSVQLSAESLPNYSSVKFKGCMDRFTIQSTPLSDKDFVIKGKNLESYYQGEPSSSYEDLLFRFGIGIPVDFSSASLSSGGYRVENLNSNYSSSYALLYNFSGSNITSSLYTGSCLTQSYSYFPHQTKEFTVVNELSTEHIGPSRLENKKVNYSSANMIDSRLSHEKSTTYKEKSNRYFDSRKLGIFVSPIHERNKDILNFFGDHDIISSVAEPSDRYGRRYLKLDEFRRNFYKKNLVSKILFNELFSIYRIFIDKSIFDTLKSVLPARNKVYAGILVEGTILERSRVEQKPAFVSEIKTYSSSIPLNDLIGDVSISTPITSSVDLTYITYNNISTSDGSFSGYECFRDRRSEYDTNIFLGEGGYVYHEGQTYKAYQKKFTKTKSYAGGRVVRRTMYSVDLVLSGSSLEIPSSYTELSNVERFRPINRKHLPFRNSIGKGRQTERTTLSEGNSEDRSPITRISVGPNIKNTNSGLKV
jgi:hypothetical protein